MPLLRLRGVLVCALLVLPSLSCGEGGGSSPTSPAAGRGGSDDRSDGVVLRLVSGGAQSGVAGMPLPEPVVVQVLDVGGNPVEGATVNFLAGRDGRADPRQDETDPAGLVRTLWTLGLDSLQQLRVSGKGGTLLLVTARATPPPVAVARVEVLPDSLTLEPGNTADYTARAFDAAGNLLSGRMVSWSVADSATARINGDGVLTALAPGSTRVTARVEGIEGSAPLKVVLPTPGPLVRLAVIPDALVLEVGESGELLAMAWDAAGHALSGRAVLWSSADSGIARVNAGGSVTGVGAGEVTITATVEGLSAGARVRVNPPRPAPVARLELIPDSLLLQVGELGSFRAVAYDSAGQVLTGRAVQWASSDSSLARVMQGNVFGVAPGSLRISALVEGISASAPVRVLPLPAAVVRVVVVPDSLALEVGQEGTLAALAYGAGGELLTGRRVTWSSQDTAVASVTSRGRVSGRVAGSTRVVASVEGVSGSARVVVRAHAGAPVVRVEVVPDSLVLGVGASGSFVARAYDAGGALLTGRAVTWFSLDSTVGRVSAGGVVTGVAEGYVSVTAEVEGVRASSRVRVIVSGAAPLITLIQKRVVNMGFGPEGGMIDVTTEYDVPVNFWVELSRRASSVSMRVHGPNGTSLSCPVMEAWNDLYREFNCVLRIPRGVEPGRWQVDRVTVDGVVYDSAALARMEVHGRVFDVLRTSGMDAQGPQTRSWVVNEWRNGPARAHLVMVDHSSGLARVSVTVQTADGRRITFAATTGDGTARHQADYYSDVAVAAGVSWRLESITASDVAGNTALLTRPDFEANRGAWELPWRAFGF